MEDIVSKDALSKATKLLRKGGEYFIEGIAILLISKAELEEKGEISGGVRTSELKKGLNQLDGDPFLTLGVLISQRLTDAEIKKKWRSLALKYHPDKTQNRTTALFALIQQAYTTLTDPVARTTLEAKLQKSQEDRDRRKSGSDRMSRAYATYSGGFGVNGVSATNNGGGGGGMPNPYDTSEYTAGRGRSSNPSQESRRPRPKSAPSRRSSDRFASSGDGGGASGCAPPPSYFPKSSSSNFPSSNSQNGSYRYTPSPCSPTSSSFRESEKEKDREQYHSSRRGSGGSSSNHFSNSDNHSVGSSSHKSSSSRYRSKSNRDRSGSKDSDRSGSKSSAGITLSAPVSLKFIERTVESATLTWVHPLFTPANMTKETPLVLFEVQWRERTDNGKSWEVSSHLLRSNICRKKNLKPSTCYEFRVRATSVQGEWSKYAESAFTVTQPKDKGEHEASSDNASTSTSRSKGNSKQANPKRGPSSSTKDEALHKEQKSKAEDAARKAGEAATSSSASSSGQSQSQQRDKSATKTRPHSSYQSRRDSYREQYNFASREKSKDTTSASSSHHSSVASSETGATEGGSTSSQKGSKANTKKEKRQKAKQDKADSSSSTPNTVKGTRTEVLRNTLNRLRKAEIDAMKEEERKMEEKLGRSKDQTNGTGWKKSQPSSASSSKNGSANTGMSSTSKTSSEKASEHDLNKDKVEPKSSTVGDNNNKSSSKNDAKVNNSGTKHTSKDEFWQCTICGRKNDTILNSYRCRACGRANDHGIAHHPFSSPTNSKQAKYSPQKDGSTRDDERNSGAEFTTEEMSKLSGVNRPTKASQARFKSKVEDEENEEESKSKSKNGSEGSGSEAESKKPSRVVPPPINTSTNKERPKSASYRSPSSSKGGAPPSNGSSSIPPSESPSYMRPIGNVMNRKYRTSHSSEKISKDFGETKQDKQVTSSPSRASSNKNSSIGGDGNDSIAKDDINLNQVTSNDPINTKKYSVDEDSINKTNAELKSTTGFDTTATTMDLSSTTTSTATVTSYSSESKHEENNVSLNSKLQKEVDDINIINKEDGIDKNMNSTKQGKKRQVESLDSANEKQSERKVFMGSSNTSSGTRPARPVRPSSAPMSRNSTASTGGISSKSRNSNSTSSYSKLSNDDLNNYVKEMELRMQSSLNFTTINNSNNSSNSSSSGRTGAGGAQRAVAAVRQSREGLPSDTTSSTKEENAIKFSNETSSKQQEHVNLNHQDSSSEQAQNASSAMPSESSSKETNNRTPSPLKSPGEKSADSTTSSTNQRSGMHTGRLRELINRANARKDDLQRIEFILDDLYIARTDSAQLFLKSLQADYPKHPLVLAAVGHCHVAGRGTTADKSIAEMFYRQVDINSLEALALGKQTSDKASSGSGDSLLSSHGSAHAQFHLGYMLQWGKGTCIKDVQRAVEWYRKAAVQNHANAQCNLGVCLYYGQGIAMNEIEAATWFARSAAQGHAKAQCNLGVCYKKGRGVPRDDAKALEYYTLSAAQGDVDATAALERLKLRREKKKKEQQQRASSGHGGSQSARGRPSDDARYYHQEKEKQVDDLAQQQQFGMKYEVNKALHSTTSEYQNQNPLHHSLSRRDSEGSTQSRTSKSKLSGHMRQRPKSAGASRSSFVGEIKKNVPV